MNKLTTVAQIRKAMNEAGSTLIDIRTETKTGNKSTFYVERLNGERIECSEKAEDLIWSVRKGAPELVYAGKKMPEVYYVKR